MITTFSIRDLNASKLKFRHVHVVMKTNVIELVDCIDAMKKLPDNSIDMVCTDPPYFLDGLGDDWDKEKIDKKGSSSMVGKLPKGMKFDRKQSKKFSEF